MALQPNDTALQEHPACIGPPNSERSIKPQSAPLRKATTSYHEEGLKLIELAQVAHDKYLAANPVKQAKIPKTIVTNLVFDGATVSATCRKPFDVLAERPSSGNWLPISNYFRTFCQNQNPEVQNIFDDIPASLLPSELVNDVGS